MNLDKHVRIPATEFEIETRGMAKAADLLYAKNQVEAARVVLVAVAERIKSAHGAAEAVSA